MYIYCYSFYKPFSTKIFLYFYGKAFVSFSIISENVLLLKEKNLFPVMWMNDLKQLHINIYLLLLSIIITKTSGTLCFMNR